MSVQVEKLEKNMAKLTITVPAETVEKALQSAYQKQKKSISVPGFRKGKVPRVYVEKMYGPAVFYEEAVNIMLSPAYSEAAAESQLEIVSQPEINVVQIEKGKEFIFTAEVAVKPEVTLGQYKGLEVKKADLTVTEEEIAEELKKEQDKNARTINVEDRPAADGDIVTLDFDGYVDGMQFEGGKADNYTLTLGSNSFVPGFEAQLVGVGLEQPVDVNITFPEDYAEELAGKDATFKCVIHKIEVKELPELDDEFAQDASEFDTLEEYKADIKKNLEEKKAASAKTEKENEAVDKAVENATMDIPDPMIDEQVNNMVNDFVNRNLKPAGLTLEKYIEFTGMTEDAFKDSLKPNAKKQIATRLVLEKVAEVENIEAPEEKLNEQIAKMAEQYKMSADDLKNAMGEYYINQMKQDLAVQEAVTLIADNAVEM